MTPKPTRRQFTARLTAALAAPLALLGWRRATEARTIKYADVLKMWETLQPEWQRSAKPPIAIKVPVVDIAYSQPMLPGERLWLKRYERLAGQVNSAPVQLSELTIEPGSMVFLGVSESRKFDGERWAEFRFCCRRGEGKWEADDAIKSFDFARLGLRRDRWAMRMTARIEDSTAPGARFKTFRHTQHSLADVCREYGVPKERLQA